MNVLSIDGLSVDFRTGEGTVRAVKDVSFDVPHNRTVALVGESGSGKTVISQTIMGLLPEKAKVTGGRVLFRNSPEAEVVDIAALDRKGRPCAPFAAIALPSSSRSR